MSWTSKKLKKKLLMIFIIFLKMWREIENLIFTIYTKLSCFECENMFLLRIGAFRESHTSVTSQERRRSLQSRELNGKTKWHVEYFFALVANNVAKADQKEDEMWSKK